MSGDEATASRSERGRQRRAKHRRVAILGVAIFAVALVGVFGSALGENLAVIVGLRGAAVPPPLAATTAHADATSTVEAGRVEVPDVRGMALLQARAVMEAAGLVAAESIDREMAPSAEQPVRAQSPVSGVVVPAGSRVALHVPSRTARVAVGKRASRTFVIVIDPGHQSADDAARDPLGPGSSLTAARATRGGIGVETRIPEYELARQLAAGLEHRLTMDGIKVVVTRTTNDVDLSEIRRAQIANAARANLVVQIHLRCEASPIGVRALYPAANEWTGRTSAASRRAAEVVQRGVVAAAGAADAGVLATSEVVGFNWSEVPCVRLEAGSLGNSMEERLLSSAKYQDRVVEGLTNGITEYLESSR